jgi:hypothetical protein
MSGLAFILLSFCPGATFFPALQLGLVFSPAGPKLRMPPPVNPFALLAPLFFAFEIWQLVLSERYMGIKQIKVNADPRELPMAGWVAAVWAGGLLLYLGWMFALLLHPVGRAQGFVLLAVTGLGYALRSASGLKWVLVILTFEGSIRIGMLISLFASTWKRMLA